MTPRRALGFVVGCLLAVSLAACGGSDVSSSGPVATTAATPTAAPPTDISGCITAEDATLIAYEGAVRASVAIEGDGAAGVVISYEQNGSVCNWLPLADRLVETGYTVLLYDRQAGVPVDYVPEMVALLRDRGIEDVSLVGGSIGGMASIRVASDIDPPPRAVVSLSGASADTVQAAPSLQEPLLQVVAADDTPFAGAARSTDEAATGSPDHQLVVVDGRAHASTLFTVDPTVIDVVDAFLQKHMPVG